MNIYRVTFRTNGELSLKTVLKAEDDEAIKQKVNRMILNKQTFKEETKNNRFFNVVLSGISFIEYDLLHNEKNYFEKYENLSDDEIAKIADKLTNPYIFATLRNEMSNGLRERILKVYPVHKKEDLEKAINNLWDVTESDILEAKEMLNDIYTEVKKR